MMNIFADMMNVATRQGDWPMRPQPRPPEPQDRRTRDEAERERARTRRTMRDTGLL